MVLRDTTSAPCRGCKDRWVSENGRCHTNCEKYKAFKEEIERINTIESFERIRTYANPLQQIKSISKKNWLKREKERKERQR